MKPMKSFDCVEMMHQGQEQVKKSLEGKTREELLAYYRQRAEEIRGDQAQLRARTSPPPSKG